MKDQDIKEVIKERYGKIARGEVTFCCPSCGPTVADQSLAVGYTPEDLQLVPEPAVLGVGCGNPTALADLKEGETVLDLGSGAGIDVFLAANKVGERGRVIGVDMTEDMVAKGRWLAAEHGFRNVEFRLGYIERLPVDSGTVDVVISNCVINLTPDKLASFKEVYRVLKPGGRILIADLVTAGELPPEVKASAAAWAECLAGAMEKEAYLETIRRAGFAEVAVVSQFAYETPGMEERLRGKIISVKVRAIKGDKPMAQKDLVAVRILELPGVSGGCACGSLPCTPEVAAMFQQKIAELRAALEEAYPGRTRVDHVNLKENQEERESEIGQLLVTKKYPGPLVVIDGEPKFAGSIQVKRIVKEVGTILS